MRKLTICIIMALLLTCLAGCGADGNPVQDTEPDDEIAEITVSEPDDGITEITVSDWEGFVKAIEPGHVIVLDGGVSMPEFKDGGSEVDLILPDDFGNPYISWDIVYDGYELTITGVTGLTIRGGAGGRSPLTNVAIYADVLRFSDCADITIENISAGHTATGTSGCDAAVFEFWGCGNIAIRDTGMYGCGAEGLRLYGVDGAAVENSEIFECTERLLWIDESTDITFRGVTFRDTGYNNLIPILYSRDILFEDCVFRDNFTIEYDYSPEYLPEIIYGSDSRKIVVRNCDFINNDTFALSNVVTDIEPVIFENCTFSGNKFEDYGELQDGVWLFSGAVWGE